MAFTACSITIIMTVKFLESNRRKIVHWNILQVRMNHTHWFQMTQYQTDTILIQSENLNCNCCTLVSNRLHANFLWNTLGMKQLSMTHA